MARSFSNAKVVSALVTKAINRRGFSGAAAPTAAPQGAAARSGAMVKKSGEQTVGSTDKISWVPDPRTGCYRPENVNEEIDAAELRATLLKRH
ncbi:hypothetical protein JCGZ_13949 [Jatropha curcas]|uniref:Uncharacterized protein n=1 Tax=Jatropha curcas TaxID=180498 RepID=A0A067JZG1_JATCU|nr:indole-3-acetic acid-induced protein ARG2 [Jatropha curcas]KDP28178.1 hypothetical protein JCGZ_13949 [Jatropha curcas]